MKKLAAMVMLLAAAIICAYISAGGEKAAEVRTISIARGTVSEALPITITARHSEVSALTAGTSGIVKEIYVKEGESVKKGEALLRFKAMGESDLSRAVVRAEEDGVVSAINVMRGAAANESTPLMTISGGGITLSSRVSSPDASRLSIGTPVMTSTGECIIEGIYHTGDGYAALALSCTGKSDLKAGEAIAGEALLQRQENVLMLPIEAAAGEEIWVARAGRARKVRVEYGVVGGGYAAVFGLEDGDRVILSDTSELADGMELREAGE